MTALRDHGLAFVDSRTSSRSVASAISLHFGVPIAPRIIFIEHDARPRAEIMSLLKREELSALRFGPDAHFRASTSGDD